jgi:hypothetical protein
MSLSSKHVRQGRRFLVAAGLAVSLFAIGCDQDATASRAIDRARMELTAMSSGETLTPGGSRTPVFQSVLAELRPVADRGTPSQNAAAALLMAQAQAGLAETPAARTTDLEAVALHRVAAVRSLFSQWLVQTAAAEAAASFDPEPEIRSIGEQVRQRQEVVTQAEAQKATVEARAADLRRQGKAKGDQAAALRQEVGRLRQQVPNQSAVEGEQTLIASREIARQADMLEVEAADLEARAEQLDPQIQELATRVEGVRDQIARLNSGRVEVEGRAAQSREEASQARAAASRFAQEMHAEVGRIRDLRDGELNAAYEAAISAYQQATSLARKAVSENRTAANLAMGASQQAIGDLQWSLAQNLEIWQQTLDMLASARPALPHAPQYGQLVEQVRGARAAAAGAATEAFQAAHSAYQAGGGSSDRIGRVTNAISAIAKRTSDGKLDLGAVAASESDAGGQPWTAESYEPGTTPQETLARFAAASDAGDPRVIDLVYVEGADQREILEALFSFAPAAKRFSDALTARFGEAGQEALANLAGQSGMLDLSSFDMASADITVNGSIAEAQLPGNQNLQLREVDGVWLIDMSEMLDQPGMEAMVQMAPRLGAAFNQLADDVEAGKYNSLEEAFSAMMMTMMRAGGGMGGG